MEKGIVNQKSKIASINPIGAEKGKGSCKLEELPQTETRSAILVNLLLSQGITGKVNHKYYNYLYILGSLTILIRICLL